MESTACAPDAAEVRELVRQQLAANRLGEAQNTLATWVAREPRDTSAALELAEVMRKRGQWRESSRPLLAAVKYLPRHVPLVLAVLQALAQRGEIVAARHCLDFLEQAPNPPRNLLLALAHLRFALREIVPARQLLERALRVGADDPDDHYLHATLLQFTGNLEPAAEVLVRCLNRWPHYGDAAVMAANLHQYLRGYDLLAHVERQLAGMPNSQDNPNKIYARASFEYAHFKLLDGGPRDAEAWDSLARCNAMMHRLNPYDAASAEAVTDALIEASEQLLRPASGSAVAPGPQPIFIVGMPRSGTTLLDRMLSSHSAIASAGEISDLWQHLMWAGNVAPNGKNNVREVALRAQHIDFAEVGARYLAQTRWRAGNCQFYIDKLPTNIQGVAFIRQALPRARIIHIERPAMDVCYSNLRALFGNVSEYSYDQGAVAHYYQQYRRLVRHWRAHLPGAMLEISYDAMVGDPAAALHSILEAFGLPFEQNCLHPERNQAPVATPSSAQVRGAIHGSTSGSWRRHARELAPLQAALGGSSMVDA